MSDQYSPNDRSLQVYQRRMYLLQSENLNLKDQLETVLYKLGSLEEIQIKYQMLLGQSENENQQLKLNQLLLDKKVQDQMQIIIEEKDREYTDKIKKLTSEHKDEILEMRLKHKQEKDQQDQRYTELKTLYETLGSKSSEMEVFSFKLKKYQKQVSELEEQLETQKQLHQQTRERELAQQKMSITKKLKQKADTEVETYEQRVRQLTKRLNQLQLQNDLLQQKQKNISISQQTSNIQKLKDILSHRKSIQRDELSKMQEALDRSGNSLRKVVEQKYQQEQKFIQRQEELKKYINDLENSILEQQKAHTREIFTLQEKMTTMKQEEIQELKSHIESMKDQFETQKNLWDNLSSDHSEEIKQMREEYFRTKNMFEQEKSRLKSKLRQLSERLEDYEGKRFDGETQQLISSLRDFDDREEKQTKYENGLVFLERQMKKANITIDHKNQEIGKMLKEITELRQQSENQINGWREKYRTEKKQLLDRIFALQNEVRDLGDKLRFKERQLQKGQKQTSFQKIELQKRIQSLQDINDQLKKDYERVVAANKTLESQYRGERDRGVSVKGDATLEKRMKWLQLQKQKNQLSIIFREKQEQLKIVYEQQIDQLRNQRDSLKQKATLLEDDKNRLTSENNELLKKVQNKENLNGKSSKKKSGEMEKKIASLNLEIALTKNLFENLEKAKSRLKSRDLNERPKQVSVVQEQNEQEYDSFQ